MDQVIPLLGSLGNPGLSKAWVEIRRAGLETQVTKDEVRTYLSKLGEKQIFRPLSPSLGKTGTEDQKIRAQVDLIDMKNSKSMGYSVILVVIDVFSRMVYARPVKTKKPEAVARVMRILLDEMEPPVFPNPWRKRPANGLRDCRRLSRPTTTRTTARCTIGLPR